MPQHDRCIKPYLSFEILDLLLESLVLDEHRVFRILPTGSTAVKRELMRINTARNAILIDSSTLVSHDHTLSASRAAHP